MAEQLFAIEAHNLINLQRWYRKAPQQFQRASAGVLNEFAFGARKKSLQIIKTRMIVRNERFVSGSLRVSKASGFMPLSAQVATFGSVARDRFTGWKEQELGTSVDRTRTSTLLARAGSKRRQMRPSLRMKRSNIFDSPDNYEGAPEQHRAIVMLQTLSRAKSRRPFIIKGHRKFKPGLYKFKGGKIRQIQQFKNPKQPKRVRWMTSGRAFYFSSVSLDAIWADKIRRQLRFN